MSQWVYVLGGKCPGGMCPGGKCPGGICPWGKCPGGTCPEGTCPRTEKDISKLMLWKVNYSGYEAYIKAKYHVELWYFTCIVLFMYKRKTDIKVGHI